MKPSLAARYRPLFIALAIIVIAGAAYAAFLSFSGTGDGPCCATEFDATPYQQPPARTLP